MGVLGRLGEQVALRADPGAQGHDDRLARGVDRRVGDLREELLEVAEQRRALIGEDGERGVVAHRADRLLARTRHRGVQHAQVLLRVAEGELGLAQGQLGRRPRGRRLEVVELHDVLVEPRAVGLLRGDRALDLVVLDDPPLHEVDEEDLARLQAPEALDVLRAHAEHPGLRAQDDVAVLRLDPAPGAQAVAIERGADDAAVGEGHRRRPVPRLHQARVEGVEALELVGEVVAILVGLRDHHHHGVRQRPPGEHEQLEHVVEGRGVRAAGAHDGQDLLQVDAEELRGERRLARPHPVDVAHQRVDLAVVADHAIGVGQLPAREGVRREAAVHERQRAGEALVLQVGVEAAQLGGLEHALVDDGPARARGRVELGADGELDDAPDDVELALEGVLVVLEAGTRLDEELADVRARGVGGVADVVLVDRHVAPAEDALALDADVELEQLLDLAAMALVARQEADAHAVAPGLGQLEVDARAEEAVRQLHQQSGAVAGADVGPLGSPVLEVVERLERLDHDVVARDVVEAGDHGDAAGVVLVPRVVQAVGLWRHAIVHLRVPVGRRANPRMDRT